jgi:hypothetical protein
MLDAIEEAVIKRSICIIPLTVFTVMLALFLAAPGVSMEFCGLTNRGPSGGILVPYGQVVNENNYIIGMHRGVFKAGYGLLGLCEMGMALPDVYEDPNRMEWAHGTTGFFKLGGRMFPGLDWFPGLAVGAENSLNRSAETYYAAASWRGTLIWWPVEASVGAGTGRFDNHAFVTAGLIPAGFFGHTLKFFCEYAGKQADVGARMAISKNLRLDFTLLMNATRVDRDGGKGWSIRMDRAAVGASMAGLVNWNRLLHPGKKKKPD